MKKRGLMKQQDALAISFFLRGLSNVALVGSDNISFFT